MSGTELRFDAPTVWAARLTRIDERARRNAGRLSAAFFAAALIAYLFADKPLTAYCLQFSDTYLEGAMNKVSSLGESHWHLAASLGIWAVWRRTRPRTARAALIVFAAVAATGLAVVLLKPLLGRCRPELLAAQEYGFQLMKRQSAYHSFPSGHAATLLALAAALGIAMPERRWTFFVLGAALALTRVFVGMHYLSDVIAGAYVGVFGTYAVAYLGFGAVPERPAKRAKENPAHA
jgi:undecaprenyl-diphosphatase